MSEIETEDRTPGRPLRFRISLKAALVGIAFIALACALVTQQFRLNDVRASLSRYEASSIPTSLESDQFRVIPRVVIDTDNCKVVTYRIESVSRHSATVGSRGDGNSASSRYEAKNGLHFSEVTILIDHTKSKNSLKLMPKVGGAQGYAVMNVADDFSLNDAVTLHREDGVYKRNETVALFRVNDRGYTLTISP